MNIVLIVPSGITGGVTTFFYNLYRGLVGERIHVNVIRLGNGKFPLLSTIYYDILNAKHLTEYDLALYIGSIPWPSHILAKLSDVPVVLFLHGFIYHELFHGMLHEAKVRNKIGAVLLVTMFKTAASFNTIDLYVSPSLTVCEDNKISDRFVLLPQWVFPEELEILKTHQALKKNSMIRIVAYTSYADSPRLLNMSHLIALAQIMKRMVNRDFDLIIVDPRKRISSFGPIKIVGPMPRQEFLSLLASADLYIERGIDEDLGQVVLEAMAMGTPIAKITHPKYWDRQDYKEDLMLARSFKELTNKVAEYIINIEYYYDYYSKIGRKFVLTKRTWDAVKEPFLTALKHISQ